MANSRTTVLITGCTTGSIGHSLALAFQRRGYRVFASTRNPATMPDLVDDPDIETLALDVCNPESIHAAKEEVSKRTGGKLDILINNAGGTGWLAPAIDVDNAMAKDVFDLNFFAALRVTNEFVPLLMQSGRDKPAHIFNTGSIAGESGNAYTSTYGAAKAALKIYGDALRIELAPFNITVTTVITGITHNGKGADYIGLRLAPDSAYKPIEGVFKAHHAKTIVPENRTPGAEYANIVVNEALKTRPRAHLYVGKFSWAAWFAATFLPLSLLARIATGTYAFDKLRTL